MQNVMYNDSSYITNKQASGTTLPNESAGAVHISLLLALSLH